MTHKNNLLQFLLLIYPISFLIKLLLRSTCYMRTQYKAKLNASVLSKNLLPKFRIDFAGVISLKHTYYTDFKD